MGLLISFGLQVHWIRTDFNKWKDEDDSDYEDESGDMDLEAVSGKRFLDRRKKCVLIDILHNQC